MIEVVTVVHIAFAAAWFGHKLLIPRDVRNSVRDPASGANLLDRMKRAQALGLFSGLVTLGTGIWLMILTTGIAEAALTTYVALGAVLAMFLVGGLVARPAWATIRDAIRSGDTPGAVGGVTSFNRAINLESLLWILALSMMVI